MLKRFAFTIIAALTLACSATARPPNIVLVISDDQAWNDYSFMGHEHVRTPNIDRLATQSLTFTRGYVPDSLCRPSLMTIVTGLHAHQHGVVGNDPPPPEGLENAPKGQVFRDPRYLDNRLEYLRHIDRVPTLPKLLAEKGYVSHQSGKWWEGGYQRGGFTHGMTHGDRTRGGRHGDEGLKIGREGMGPVFDFIDLAAREQKPFFIWYAPFLPHTPHNPPDRLLDKYREKTPHLPIAKYWAMCEWFDETVGELLGRLDEKGIAGDTIVIYVTDNGWINAENASRYAPRSKRSQYDGGVRTPIMVRWPGKVEPKMDKVSLASSIDIAPTVLAACGLAPTKDMQGVNLLDAGAVAKRDTIYGEIFEHDIQHMTDPVPSLRFRWAITKQWKLIVPHKGREPNAPVELYDVLADPFEQENVANERSDVVTRMKSKINAWWAVR